METTTTGSGLSVQYTVLPTKKDIIQRLFQEEKISFDEMWVLLQDNENVRFVIMPQPAPIYPYPAPYYPLTWITSNVAGLSTVTNKIIDNENHQN